MEKLKSFYINPSKKYLILSKSTTFLEKMRDIVYSKLNIDDVYDTKTHKNSMTFESIILKNGGFIKFFLYNSNLMRCVYDDVFVDSVLYATDYYNIRSKCLLANIHVITEVDSIPDILQQRTLEVEPSSSVVLNRKFSYKNFSDYGNCPKCNRIVYSYDKKCPVCEEPLNWDLSKLDIINLCNTYGDFNEDLGTNLMKCNENWYNRYYCLSHTFGKDKLESMTEEELKDLLTLADNICAGLY